MSAIGDKINSRGNVDDFIDAHDLYYPVVYNAIYAKIGDHDDTADICQDVFSALFEKFADVENPRKWLFGALRLAVYEYYRRKTKVDIPLDEAHDDIALTFVNGMRDTRIIIADIIENGDLFDTNLDAVIFDLVALGELSYRDAARELGVTKRIVEYRYRRIAEKVIANLRDRGIRYLEDIL